MVNAMRSLLIAAVAAAGLLFTSAADAGCGKKVGTTGELAKYDADSKTLTIKVKSSNDPKELESKVATLTLTPNSKIMGDAKVDSLVGASVTVVSEHGKIDFVIPVKAALTVN